MKKQKFIKNFSHSDRGAADEESNNRSSRRYAPQDDEGRKKGFTLVELSIVLVIIGLLIGGILVGQSLIESAKMQSFVRQIAQYDALAASFKSKFGNLPGDASVFGCTDNILTSGNVCNNGAIEAAFSSPIYYFFSESSLYWKHLSDSGFRPSGVSYTQTITASTVKAGTNVPEAQVGIAGVAVYGTVSEGNYYLIAAYNADSAINTTAGLTAIDALAYDSKVDDGAANAGNVQQGLAAPTDACNNNSTTPAVYNVNSGSTLVCSLRIRHMSGISF